MENVWFAFGLTLFAGLATGIGSVLALLTKRTNGSFLSVSLGFSAGVMVYVSFVEILQKSTDALQAALGPGKGEWAAVGSFFLGILVIMFIDHLVPEFENPHQPRERGDISEMRDGELDDSSALKRMGMMSALAIGIHNFPEGIASFASALSDPALGVSIAIAIAIHNIPEGISVSVPIYYSTGSRKKAFVYSFLSGLSEPIGALIGFFIFRAFFNDMVFGLLFGMVAGIMVFISIDELLPVSRKYGKEHQEVYGFLAGMAVMALSLLLF